MGQEKKTSVASEQRMPGEYLPMLAQHLWRAMHQQGVTIPDQYRQQFPVSVAQLEQCASEAEMLAVLAPEEPEEDGSGSERIGPAGAPGRQDQGGTPAAQTGSQAKFQAKFQTGSQAKSQTKAGSRQDAAGVGKLQQAMAYLVNYVPSRWLLECEAAELHAKRQLLGRESEPFTPGEGDVYAWADGQMLSGLCLSGGGIRSATFNLGILQGLAERRALGSFDYLSSVSGGGYIHGWLAAWLKREEKRHRTTGGGNEGSGNSGQVALAQVEAELTPVGAQAAASPGVVFAGQAAARVVATAPARRLFAPHEIKWLRQYSNYLTPRKGAVSPDTLVAAAVWVRNTLISQLILGCALLFLLTLPHVCFDWLAPLPATAASKPPATLTFAGTEALLDGTKGGLSVALQLHVDAAPATAPGPGFSERYNQNLQAAWKGGASWPPHLCGGLLAAAVLSLLAGGWSMGRLSWMEKQREDRDKRASVTPLGSDWAPAGVEAALRRIERARLGAVYGLSMPALPLAVMLLVAPPCRMVTLGLLGGLLGVALGASSIGITFAAKQLQKKLSWRTLLTAERLAQLGVLLKSFLAPAVASLLGTGVFVLIAALLRALFAIGWGASAMRNAVPSVELCLGLPLLACVPFAMLVFLAAMGGRGTPAWLLEVFAAVRAASLRLAGIATLLLVASLLLPDLASLALATTGSKVSAIASWLAATLAGVLGGKSEQASQTVETAPSKSSKVMELLALIGPYVYVLGLVIALASLVQLLLGAHRGSLAALAYAAMAGGGFLLLASRYDANTFSMYPFYRDRLVRCYLGASNRRRVPSPLTGFDNSDVTDLRLPTFTAKEHYPGPFPIFCTTLNLTTGKDLAFQERKGASFIFTPKYSGYTVAWTEGQKGTRFNGFVPTEKFSGISGGLHLGAAMAVSGAALSPNWGYHSRPATAFLLTMFNARLGRWMPNPRRLDYRGHERDFDWYAQARLLFRELGGKSDDGSKWVYLSDGGHFDNMGLYELVRRRCQRIVVCDAEQDETYTFSGIGMAIRKCRIDFGVEISLDLTRLRLAAQTRFSSAHWVEGTVRYPEAAEAGRAEARILYIKSSLCGATPSDLPVAPGDLQNYWLEHGNFPHDSTLNQWFTESQFESYRRLGQAVVEALPFPLLAGPTPAAPSVRQAQGTPQPTRPAWRRPG